MKIFDIVNNNPGNREFFRSDVPYEKWTLMQGAFYRKFRDGQLYRMGLQLEHLMSNKWCFVVEAEIAISEPAIRVVTEKCPDCNHPKHWGLCPAAENCFCQRKVLTLPAPVESHENSYDAAVNVADGTHSS